MSSLFDFYIKNNIYKISEFSEINIVPRDKSSAKFLRHSSGLIIQSEVIHSDDCFENNNYVSTSRQQFQSKIDLQDEIDTSRRLFQFKNICNDKSIVDFGCGYANFLKGMVGVARNVCGIELSDIQRNSNQVAGIQTYKHINEINFDPDIIFFFHSFHYLLDPVSVIREIINARPKASEIKFIIEVPSAMDILLRLNCFLEFTLHKELIVIHTIESLKLLFRYLGFTDVKFTKYQRYGLDNHLEWMVNRRPGGHLNSVVLPDQAGYDAVYKSYTMQKGFYDTIIAEFSNA